METVFKNISKIKYEGPKSRNPLAFKHYNPAEVVEGKTMREHLRFSVVYWHTFRNALSDPFGVGTAIRPWDDGSNSVANAENRARVAFEFIEKLGAPFYAFHDRDIAPEGRTLRETNKNLDAVVKVLKEEQKRTGIKLLWGTANLFTQSAVRSRRGHELQCRRVRLRRRAGEEGAGSHPRTGRRRLCFLGRARRLFHPAEHQHETRAGTPRQISAPGGGLQKENRLQRPVLHRAETEGTDQASIRFRRRRVPEFPARIRSDGRFEAQPRDQPRHAGRSYHAA